MTTEMTLHECQSMAKKSGYNCATFTLVGAFIPVKCKWLYAYFGTFQIIEGEEFLRVDESLKANPELRCINFDAAGEKK